MSPTKSKTFLSQKLGLKENQKVCFLNTPSNYKLLLGEITQNIHIDYELNELYYFIHFFSKNKIELKTTFPKLNEFIFQDGLIWISRPKKSSKMETSLEFNIVQKIGLRNGLVDVKVCAIDNDWSGLKFVFRLKDQKKEQ
jgi:hypothetical protein